MVKLISASEHRDRSFWILIPAGVVIGLETVPDFEDGEHAPHGDVIERSRSANHW